MPIIVPSEPEGTHERWRLAIDPSAAISGRTELALNSGAIAVSNAGVDFGEAAVSQYMAEQRYGQTPVSFRVPNRTVTIPLVVGAEPMGTVVEEEEARRKLNEKVALLQRQGGVLLRQRAGGEPLYADIVNATLTLPDVYGETGGVEPNVTLKLECLPDFYGEEITLDAVEQTGQIVQVLQQGGKQAVIAGDYPARTRIILTEKGKQNQRGMLWGLRSTHYDVAATASLSFDATELTPINGAAEATKTGTFSGKWIELAEPEVEVWHPFLTTDLKTTKEPLTHVGSYRVWARVQNGLEAIKLRLAWSTDDAILPTYNAAVTLGAQETFQLIDLGTIRAIQPPVGKHWWRGVLQVETGGGSHFIAVDRVWMQPVDDGAGRLRATASNTSTSVTRKASCGIYQNASALGAGTVWSIVVGANRVSLGAGEFAEALRGRKLNAGAISSGATIHSISVRLTTEANTTFEGKVKLVKSSGVAAGSASVAIGAGTEVSTLSLGALLTAEELKDAESGAALVELTPTLGHIGSGWTCTATMELIIVYSFSAEGLATDAVLYSERLSEVRWEGALREDTTTGAYAGISQNAGDLPRLPPSGLEGRAVELFIKNTRGDLTPEKVDAGIDALIVQVKYRPCYLGRV